MIVTALLFISGLVIALAAGAVTNSNTQIAFGSISLAMLGVAGARAMLRGGTLRNALATGQLGPYFGMSTAVVFGLSSLVWVGGPQNELEAIISRTSIIAAMLLIGVGLVCLLAGYIATPSGVVRSCASWLQRTVLTDHPVRPGQGAAWLLLSVAFLAYLAQTVNGTFGYLSDASLAVSASNPASQILAVVGGFSVFAVALAANDYARQRGSWRLLSFFALLGSQLIMGAATGNKEIVALGFVAALLGYAARVRRVPIATLVVAVLAFVFIVVPFNTSYRAAIAVGNSRLSPLQVLQDVVQQGPGFLLPATTSGASQSPLDQTLRRISRIGDVAIIVQKTPSVIAGRPVIELLEAPALGLIPRALWPDKPVLATGYLFSQQYYNLPSTVYTSNAVTPEGDLWRHGGWIVAVAGMTLLGGVLRVLDTASEDVSIAPTRIFLILAVFPLVVKQEVDVVSLVASVPSLLFGVALAARLVTRRQGSVARSFASA